MSSVRVEVKAQRDARMVILGNLMGVSKFDALGRMISLWSYCTENNTYTITPEVINILAEFAGFSEFICQAGLAENVDDCTIRIKGTRDRIEWLQKKRIGGKLGGRPRKDAKEPIGIQSENLKVLKEEPFGYQTENPLALAPAPALAQKQELKAHSRPADLNVKENTAKFIAAYVIAFQARYGPMNRPDLSKRVQGQIKTFLADHSLETAIELIEIYLKMDDTWFVTKCHDFTTFTMNLNKIGIHKSRNQLSHVLNFASGKIEEPV